MRTRTPIHRAHVALTLAFTLVASVLLGVSPASAQETQIAADYVFFTDGLSGPRPAAVGSNAVLSDVDLIRGNNADEVVTTPIPNSRQNFPTFTDGDFFVRVTFDNGSRVSNVRAVRDFSIRNFGTTIDRWLLDQAALGGRTLAEVTDVDIQRREDHDANWDDLGFRETVIAPPNQRPTTRSDTYLARSGETLTVSAAEGVLANDSDPEGDSLTASLRATPNPNGTITVNPDGSFAFRPNANFTGRFDVGIAVSDGRATTNSSIRFIVQSPRPTGNAAPVAVDDQYEVTAGQLTGFQFVTQFLGANDVYAVPDALSYELVSATPGLDVSITLFGRIGIVADNSLGGSTVSFDYRVSDGLQSDTGTAFVTVQPANGPPPTTAPPTTQPPTTQPPTTAPPTTQPPTTAPPTTQPPTTQPPTTQPPAPVGGSVLLSLARNRGGFANEDIVEFDPATGQTSLVFDGSDVGLGRADVHAFAEMADGSLLLNLDRNIRLGGVTVTRHDILRFNPTSLGNRTRGSFSIFLDGSDVGLSTNGERIDAIDVVSENGNVALAISTVGSVRVPGINGRDEDLNLLTLTRTGATSRGTWARYFDGSDLGLTNNSEDLAAVAANNGELLFATQGSFNASGASGNANNIVTCDNFRSGGNTRCGDVAADFNLNQAGLGGARIDGLDTRN